MGTRKTLEERFIDFAKNLDEAESIDSLKLIPDQENAEKADFLFNRRRVICELKSLKKNTEYKVTEILLPYQERPEWPIFYGEWEISKILRYLPDRERIHRKIFEAVASAIEGVIRKTNSQIKSTKNSLNIPFADGLLVLLNDMVDILSPEVIVHKVFEVLLKRTTKGEARFFQIKIVWIINETHFIQTTPSLRTIPSFILFNPLSNATAEIEIFVESLQPKWAAYNGLPFMGMQGESFRGFEFKKIRDKNTKQKDPMTRAELFRLNYNRHPYLRSLSKDELLTFGHRVFEELTPQFLKGTPKKPLDQIGEVLKRWADFLEEINIRGIDMREFGAWMKSKQG